MDKTNITVTMPVTEYERLKDVESAFTKQLNILVNTTKQTGEPIMTESLKQLIKDLECDL